MYDNPIAPKGQDGENQVEGDGDTGRSHEEYLQIINSLRECDNTEWKMYLDNFKKHKIDDTRLKQYWSKYNDHVWQELIPEFGVRYQFKDLWGKKLKNHHHKITEKEESS
eukprot:336513_1